jgi:ribosomal RNA assembly protein
MLVKIPLERVGVLVGPSGRVKGAIEKRSGVKMEVNSKAGDVELTLACGGSDPSMLFTARDIVLAIGRGFSPDKALRLLNDDVSLSIIDLRDYLGKSQADIIRVKGRIIGRRGKTRRIIEEFTGTSISVYGRTVSIIGELEPLEVAKEAVELLIRGSLHKSVYRFLRWRRSDLKKGEAEIWKPSASELARGEA